MLSIILAFIFALTQVVSGNNCNNHGSFGRIIGGHAVPIEDKGSTMRTNLLNWCNLVSISKNVVFYAFLVVRIYYYLAEFVNIY